MPRFKFRLTSLLRVREAARDERRAQLAEAYAAQRVLESRRSELEAELRSHQARFRSGVAPGRIDVDQLLAANRYELVIRAEVAVVARHEEQLAVEVERRREALVAAEREVRVLEKLRERQQETHRAHEALAETKRLDEVASRREFAEEVA